MRLTEEYFVEQRVVKRLHLRIVAKEQSIYNSIISDMEIKFIQSDTANIF